jgi:hypothetical protein
MHVNGVSFQNGQWNSAVWGFPYNRRESHDPHDGMHMYVIYKHTCIHIYIYIIIYICVYIHNYIYITYVYIYIYTWRLYRLVCVTQRHGFCFPIKKGPSRCPQLHWVPTQTAQHPRQPAASVDENGGFGIKVSKKKLGPVPSVAQSLKNPCFSQ